MAVLEADVEKPFTSLLFISDIWYDYQMILSDSSIIFTVGALLIALHMSAMYFLLLTFVLVAFILQTIKYYIGFSTIPGELNTISIIISPKLYLCYSIVGVIWIMVSVCSVYIFFAEIVNTIAERHLIPLGNALFDYKELKLVNPFS